MLLKLQDYMLLLCGKYNQAYFSPPKLILMCISLSRLLGCFFLQKITKIVKRVIVPSVCFSETQQLVSGCFSC